MSDFFAFLVCAVLAYLLGSIPFGKIAGKLYGIDIQKHGSGNIGFANSVRVLGWKAGFFVLAGDVAKGFAAAMLAYTVLPYKLALFASLAAIAGHIFPVWLHFKGGKGIATGLGITLAFAPLVAVLGLLVYLVTFSFAKKSGPSSVAAALSLPIFSVFIIPSYAIYAFLLALIGIWTHWDYIRPRRTTRRRYAGK